MLCVFTAVFIVDLVDVEVYKKNGSRLVRFDEVDDGGAMGGIVAEYIIKNNYYTDLKLDKGQIASKRLCDDVTCDKRSIKFELVPDTEKLITLDSVPQYAVMTGNKSLLRAFITLCLQGCVLFL